METIKAFITGSTETIGRVLCGDMDTYPSGKRPRLDAEITAMGIKHGSTISFKDMSSIGHALRESHVAIHAAWLSRDYHRKNPQDHHPENYEMARILLGAADLSPRSGCRIILMSCVDVDVPYNWLERRREWQATKDAHYLIDPNNNQPTPYMHNSLRQSTGRPGLQQSRYAKTHLGIEDMARRMATNNEDLDVTVLRVGNVNRLDKRLSESSDLKMYDYNPHVDVRWEDAVWLGQADLVGACQYLAESDYTPGFRIYNLISSNPDRIHLLPPWATES